MAGLAANFAQAYHTCQSRFACAACVRHALPRAHTCRCTGHWLLLLVADVELREVKTCNSGRCKSMCCSARLSQRPWQPALMPMLHTRSRSYTSTLLSTFVLPKMLAIETLYEQGPCAAVSTTSRAKRLARQGYQSTHSAASRCRCGRRQLRLEPVHNRDGRRHRLLADARHPGEAGVHRAICAASHM